METRVTGTTWKGEYDISRARRVWLDATPGDATVAHVRIHLGTEVVFSGPRVQYQDLGSGEDLQGKRILIVCGARRAAPQSTLVSLRVALQGGPQPLEVLLSTAPVGATDVTFVLTIDLKARA